MASVCELPRLPSGPANLGISDELLLKCPQCSYSTSDEIVFRTHGWNLHVIDPVASRCTKNSFQSCLFSCPLCLSSTTELENLKVHFLKAHSVEEPSLTESNILINWIKLEVDSDIEEEESVAKDGSTILPFSPISNLQLPTSSVPESEQLFPASSSSLSINPDVVPGFHTPFLKSSESHSQPQKSGVVSGSVSLMNLHSAPNNHAAPSVTSSTSRVSSASSTHASSAKLQHAASSKVIGQTASRDWSKLIARADKKFTCLLCPYSLYNGRTEVVFHVSTRHLLGTLIERELSQFGYLTTKVKRSIGSLFADGMRIRSGVHYKDAERVEAALYRSIELHLRYSPPSSSASPKVYTCSGCKAIFTDPQLAFVHINDELRVFLPEFMRTRSCPWSLSSREEWVWCVPDIPLSSPSVSDTIKSESVDESDLKFEDFDSVDFLPDVLVKPGQIQSELRFSPPPTEAQILKSNFPVKFSSMSSAVSSKPAIALLQPTSSVSLTYQHYGVTSCPEELDSNSLLFENIRTSSD